MIASVFNQHKDKLCYHAAVNSGKRKSTCYFRSRGFIENKLMGSIKFFLILENLPKVIILWLGALETPKPQDSFILMLTHLLVIFPFFQAECMIFVQGVDMQILEDTIYSHNWIWAVEIDLSPQCISTLCLRVVDIRFVAFWQTSRLVKGCLSKVAVFFLLYGYIFLGGLSLGLYSIN